MVFCCMVPSSPYFPRKKPEKDPDREVRYQNTLINNIQISFTHQDVIMGLNILNDYMILYDYKKMS